MPRGFNQKEKEKIKETLINEGKQLFSRYGLKKTSVNELTKAAGIAPGSFYTFFTSKEELYFEILEEEEEMIKKEFVQFELPKGEGARQAIKDLILQTFTMIDEHPMFSQFYFENDHAALVRKLPEEKLEAHFNKDSDTLSLLTSKWKEEGILKDIDDDVLAGLFRGLFCLSLHKKEIGESVYPQSIDLLAGLIVDGLVIKEES
ncbi:TetR/AcrR family transcriptional regulator [Halobacillus massiliensis]|uniref:TetR/AcrR family transcriptional regulator n=1 Tax=Halobacillus massiliensis TaxID=1926286 RepID=UPI0015C47C91|nr:TetR/AcrR family transcriptional regulator [Halobacillus massiliensis]